MRESKTTKARRLLSQGKLTVVEARPDRVHAFVVGDTGIRSVRYRNGIWSCDCPALRSCSHQIATRLVSQPDINDAGAQDARIRR